MFMRLWAGASLHAESLCQNCCVGILSRHSFLQVQVGGSPEYYVERKLGKGGFGQVYVGRRVAASKAKDGPTANQVRVLCKCKCPTVCCRGVPHNCWLRTYVTVAKIQSWVSVA